MMGFQSQNQIDQIQTHQQLPCYQIKKITYVKQVKEVSTQTISSPAGCSCINFKSLDHHQMISHQQINHCETERSSKCRDNSKTYQYQSEDLKSQQTIQVKDQLQEEDIKQRLNLDQKAKIIFQRGPDIDVMQIPQYTFVPSLKTFIYVKVYKPESKRWSSLFMCEFKECKMNFRKWNNLYDHLRSHCDERPYECPVESCGKQFTQKSNLEKHLRIHKNKSYLKCSVCKRFFTKFRIIKHFLMNHNQEDNSGEFSFQNALETNKEVLQIKEDVLDVQQIQFAQNE
ncbi:zinc c2h2 type family protein [Stylonychia lemnae]|uniref:Zinc c2h2 type family protein n=1 Tax=Stylonychia lemnae TaxID=5949 RepID=A0A078B083_STYLE|nr:zinc c2h2 type family protein [Stylonychia lemnae]|eukprot:CDW86493.1 zinc c2h2 type family protein [Stylonychia lemnae]